MADSKKQFLAYIFKTKEELRAMEAAYYLKLREFHDFISLKTVEICAWHTTNVDSSVYEPDEGLNGRSIYKLQNIIINLSSLLHANKAYPTKLAEYYMEIHENINKFMNDSKYYFPDETIEKK